MKTNLTAQQVQELFRYEPETGHLWWVVRRRGYPKSKPAGRVSFYGYVVVVVGGQNYYAHRLIWLLTYGEWPDCDIDHINGDKADNRLSNLRLASRRQNKWNVGVTRANKSGFKGVSWCAERLKWMAAIKVGSKAKNLGRYASAEEAHEVYDLAAQLLHGDFHRTAQNPR